MWMLAPEARLTFAATRTQAGGGGIARVARLSVKSLAAAGRAVRVRSLLDTPETVISSVPAATSGSSRARFAAGLYRDAFRSEAFLFDHVGAARAHPRWPRRPLAIWLHGIEIWGNGLTPQRAAALKSADRLLVNSHYTLARFEAEHFALPNAKVVLLGTEEDAAPNTHDLGMAPPAPDGPPTALCFGRLDRDNMQKGHVEIVEAWPKVVAAIPHARLLVAGGGDGLDTFRKIVAASPAAGSIEVLGFVPEADVPALWRRSSIYVQPSWKEGFGLTYVEAMRQSLPVVASTNDAGAEVNADGASGINVDLNRPDEYAEKLIALLRDPDRMAILGRGAFERWRTMFRFSNFAERFLSALD